MIIRWTDESESYCCGLEGYDELIRRLAGGETIADLPPEKLALLTRFLQARQHAAQEDEEEENR